MLCVLGSNHQGTALSFARRFHSLRTPAPVASQELDAIVARLDRWTVSPEPAIHSAAVGEDADGERFLRVAGQTFATLGSRSQAENAAKRGALLLNGDVVETSRRVRAGDQMTLQEAAEAPPSAAKLEAIGRFVLHLQSQGLRTPYEDDHCAVVFKPPGIHTKAGTRTQRGRKWSALEDALPAELTPSPLVDALPKPLVMHRLDVPVSGLCIVAKTRAAARHLSSQFERRTVSKTYHAILLGEVPGLEDGSRSRLIDASVNGQPAVSELELLGTTPHANWGCISTVRMRPRTGRTHQLRLHAARALGTPIIGDDLYWHDAEDGRATALPPVKKSVGLFLQSCGVRFEHPAEADRTVEVLVPELRKFGALRERAQRGADYTSIGALATD